MARNSAKMQWTLEELGWTLHPPGDSSQWDGLIGWFLQYTAAHPETLVRSIKGWHNAATTALSAV
jgi:hypothetical protein